MDVLIFKGTSVRGTPRLFVVIAPLCVLLLSSCTHQDFGRPLTGSLSDVIDSGKPYAGGGGAPDVVRRARSLAKVLAEWQRTPGAEGRDYTIGPDDVLEVGVLNLEEPGKTSKLLRTVSQGGDIGLPWVGSIGVRGLSIRQAEAKVVSVLAGRLIKDPQVTVAVASYRSAPVVVTGAVTKPGVYYLDHDRVSLLELLAKADGLSADAGDEVLLVRGLPPAPTNGTAKVETPAPPVGEKGETAAPAVGAQAGTPAPPARTEETNSEQAVIGNLITIDLKQLLDTGDVRLNVWLQSGDILTVPARERGYVYVLGYVQRPGGVEVLKGKTIGALHAVAMAGGLSGTARAENCSLLRETPTGQKVIPVDLTKIARGVRPPLDLEPGDTLVVGSSFLARMSEFIRPTIGAGMSYTPVP